MTHQPGDLNLAAATSKLSPSENKVQDACQRHALAHRHATSPLPPLPAVARLHARPRTHLAAPADVSVLCCRGGRVLDGLVAFCALSKRLGSAAYIRRLHLPPGEAVQQPPCVPACWRPEFFLRHDTRAKGPLRAARPPRPLDTWAEVKGRRVWFPGCTCYEIHLGVPRAYVLLGAQSNSLE